MAKAIEKPPVKKRIWWNKKHKAILSWVIQIAAVLILAALVSWFFLCGTVVQENSMAPTVQANDQVRINRLSYFFGSPDRGDVIAFYKNSDKDSTIQIKRVIAIPGDTVQIKDGIILVNGETYMESESFPKINHAGMAEDPIKLGKEENFVLGDNRNNSEDSRFADMGNVLEENIIGKVWITTSPFSRFGFN